MAIKHRTETNDGRSAIEISRTGAVERLANREDRTRNAEKSRLGMAPGMAHESAGDDGAPF